MTNVNQLYRLQGIDSAIQENKQRLGQILQAQKEPADLMAARERHEALQGELVDLRRRSKDQELLIGTVTGKLAQTTERLYSGREKNPKALQDLQQEADYLTRHQADLEDHLLEIMVSLEETEEKGAAAAARLAELDAAWREKLARLQAEQYEVATHLNDLLAQRREAAARLDARILAVYDGLLKSKRGVAVAVVSGDTCQGCRVSLNANELRAVERGELVHCGNCGRILFVP